MEAKKVFISYSSQNTETARKVRKTLDVNGISCWMAERSIDAGASYLKEIPKAIKECEIFLLLLSKEAQESDWISKELGMAISYKKEIIPFMIAQCELTDEYFFSLQNIQIYFAYANPEESLKELVNKLRDDLNIEGEEETEDELLDSLLADIEADFEEIAESADDEDEEEDEEDEDDISASCRQKGIVKWWNDRLGFGFITDERGCDIMVHYSGIQMEGLIKLVDGQLVTFEVAEGAKGPMAVNVKPL
ncbi:MAG: TIR domain-containing protein [Lachnospiraceae bacterium]|nr:TIR domain-containing protein [Lachnospiraceae bacterium]